MREVTRVHLAKVAYDVELNAKTSLEEYLSAIEKTMEPESNAMREIEARITELLAERKVKPGGVITADDVQAIRQQMGEPKDFSDSQADSASDTNNQAPEDAKPQKRLMRDGDDSIIGGVCSGLAAYFGTDPIWVRLIAVATLLISMGSALLAYIILWIVMPLAETSADKLVMRGEKVTLASLKSFSNSNTASESSQAIAKIGRITVGFILATIAIGAFIATMVGGIIGIAAVDWMEGFDTQPWAGGMLASLIAGGIALTILSALLAQMVFSWKIKKPVGIASMAMLMIGILSIPLIAVFSIQAKSNFSADKDRLTRVVPISLPKQLDGIKNIETVGCRSAKSNLNIIPTESDTFRAELKYIAFKNAKQPQVSAYRQDDSLFISIKNQTDQKDYPFFINSHYCGGEDIWVDLYQPVGSSVDHDVLQTAPYEDTDYDDF
ncbi:hypothetical protein CR970_02305 [Candidatus Saccharibacteria bacterium]|nr:MAG: hypothetical protein CR970_02305 [Candidatus Saccharibacteria bacterium]